MRNHDKLRISCIIPQEIGKALNVGIIQRRVNFVQDTERRWLIAQKSKEQRDNRQRSFAAAHQIQALQFFAGWLDVDINTGIQQIIRLGEPQHRRTTAKYLDIALRKVFVDFGKGLLEAFSHTAVDFSDNSLQIFLRCT